MTQYYLAYADGNTVIRYRPNAILEKFDSVSKEWTPDINLGRIFFGDMPVKVLSSDEARRITEES